MVYYAITTFLFFVLCSLLFEVIVDDLNVMSIFFVTCHSIYTRFLLNMSGADIEEMSKREFATVYKKVTLQKIIKFAMFHMIL